MARRPLAGIFVGPGTNCHHQKANMVERAGARTKFILRQQWLDGKVKLTDFDLLFFPGGFLDGDHFRSAVVGATDFVYRFRDQTEAVIEKGTPILVNCNGFQLLVAMGVFSDKLGKPDIILDHNMSGTFEHWNNRVMVLHHNDGCAWTEGLDGLQLKIPSSHGEGFFRQLSAEKPLWKVAATYGTYEGVATYPISPNGQSIAGISLGNILGFMPHTEREQDDFDGNEPVSLCVYRNGVNYVR